MHYLLSRIALLSSLVSYALGHGYVHGFDTDGKYNEGFDLIFIARTKYAAPKEDTAGWRTTALNMGYVNSQGYTNGDIVCHLGATNAKKTASISAGGTVKFFWSPWMPQHLGPIVTYIADCGDDCTTVDKNKLKWVKIDEAGYVKDHWATDDLVKQNSTWSLTIPKQLASGHYTVRHEVIAIHPYKGINMTQHYPQCVNIDVKGGGSEKPDGTLGKDLYSTSDKNLHPDNGWGDLSNYKIPGPALWKPGSSSKGKARRR